MAAISEGFAIVASRGPAWTEMRAHRAARELNIEYKDVTLYRRACPLLAEEGLLETEYTLATRRTKTTRSSSAQCVHVEASEALRVFPNYM